MQTPHCQLSYEKDTSSEYESDSYRKSGVVRVHNRKEVERYKLIH